MTAIAMTKEPDVRSVADKTLGVAARLWLLVAVIGQWLFLYYIATFYGPSTLTGNFQAWSLNKQLIKGYVPGDTVGNLAFGAHALLAGVIAFGGALQLIPQIRARVPAVHRWNGRLFMGVASALSISGLYMVWVRGATTGLVGSLAITLNAALILAFVTLAWRAARAREFATHRRWALRLYLVANAQFFTRVGIFAWIVVNQGTRGLDPFFLFWNFGCYLVPLAILELYLRAKGDGGPRRRFAVAGALVVATALMSVGIFGYTLSNLPLLPKL